MKFSFFWLAASLIPTFSLAEPPCLPSEPAQEATEPELLALFKKVTQILSVVGQVVPDIAETCDATKFVYELANKDAGDHYQKGDPDVVWSSNQGLIHHFKHLQDLSPSMKTHEDALSKTMIYLDRIHPLEHKALLSDSASYNTFEIALKETEGNVFKAVTLLGKIGHDDLSSPVGNRSHLFARQSLGKEVDVPVEILNKYKEATMECLSFHGFSTKDSDLPSNSPKETCAGAGAANNYHMIAGFYMGCQLAKKGFRRLTLPKWIVNQVAKETHHEFLPTQWETKKGLLMDQSCLNLCSDIPASSSYCYKQLTLPRFLSNDAKILFNAGYTRPFQHKEKTFETLKNDPLFKEWGEKRLNKALGNLDLRLMNIEYTYAQHKAGAEFGAKVCREFKKSIKPIALINPKTKTTKDASRLYELGYFSSKVTSADLTRSSIKHWSEDRKLKALEFLKGELQKIPSQMDFGEEPASMEVPK